MTMTIYEQLSKERKQLQAEGEIPMWFTTGGWQLFKDKYLHEATALRDTYERIAKTAANHLPEHMQEDYEEIFFQLMWKGWLALSTPVLSNMGTNKGMPVSCSGQLVEDSINGFYTAYKEVALLTQKGFGTSSYLGDIRPRGSIISAGGTASGVVDVITSFVDDMRKVAQGTARRGAWAGYLPIDHGDFFEVADYLMHYPDDLNLGWVVTDEYIQRLEDGDKAAILTFQKAMKVKAVTGKGYFFFVDKVNRQNPDCYTYWDYRVHASNLCIEIALTSSESETFTCVLSSMNAAKYNEWKGTSAVMDATVFLDCVASEFIELARNRPGFEKAVKFTERHRALGLGVLGFHTYLQQEMIPFESFDAHLMNTEIFSYINEQATLSSEWMYKALGTAEVPECESRRNTHLIAVAPNSSSALICGGVSQGIEPVVANLYNQPTAAGEIYRVNPVFLKLAKDRNKFDDDLVNDLIETEGSVQHLDWLTDHEKLVFKTAYEIDQEVILRLASVRQKYICQSQSLNLFFDADESEEHIAYIHKLAFLDPNIKGLYYMRTKAGVQASKGECLACEG